MIPYGRQDIRQADIDAVLEVLTSDFLTQGPVVPKFEGAVAEFVSADYAVAVNSATSALHIACAALELGPGDLLWTSPITFVASANCGIYCGADVDFVDIDPDTFNMCAERLAEKLHRAEGAGRLPKVVVPVHMCGQSCDMEAIGQLSEKYGFRVIEDASHAIGGSYRGARVGNCAHSDITVFSFHPVKIVTTAEGGMAMTNDSELADRMSLLRSHGITRNPAVMEHDPDGPWYYEQVGLGFNYRMTDVHAALGLSQLDRLTDYVARRHELAAVYDARLGGLPVATPFQMPASHSAYHLYVIRLVEGRCAPSRKDVFIALREQGVGVNVHYIPVHLQPFYRRLGFGPGDFPAAERYYSSAVTLPLHPNLTEAQQEHVVTALRNVLAE